MKFSQLGRFALTGAATALLALGITSCSRDYVSDYVYTVSKSNGNISAFAVDFQTGLLNQISGSPFTSNLSNPSTIVSSPNGKYVYVIGGSQNSQVAEFAVGTDGKLYGQKTYTLTGTCTNVCSAAIDSTGAFLYVTFTYQQGFTPASPGPGGVTIFPITASDSSNPGGLGTPTTLNVGNNPVGIAITKPVTVGSSSNVYAYVLDQEPTPNNAQVLGYQMNQTTGALTPLPGTTQNSSNLWLGYAAGITPSAIAVEPTGRFIYVTDRDANQVIGYSRTLTGDLVPIKTGPFSTGAAGLFPLSLTIEPRGKYLYTANFNGQSVSGFAIDGATGNLSGVVSSSSFSVATGPTCVTVEPALGIYLYTSNQLDGSISAAQLSPNTGALTAVADTPFPASSLPSCITSVANGEHDSQVTFPN